MLQQSTYIEIDLGLGEAASLVRSRHCRLHCLSGTLWLTEENGGGDIVLNAGDCLHLTRPGRTVIQAVGRQPGARCRLALSAPAWWRRWPRWPRWPRCPLRAQVTQRRAAWHARDPAIAQG